MNYFQVIKHLKIDEIPVSISHGCIFVRAADKRAKPFIPVVREDYLADCISFRSILDPRQRMYRVDGHVPEPFVALQQPEAVQQSLDLKPAKKSVQARPPQTPPLTTISTVDPSNSSRDGAAGDRDRRAAEPLSRPPDALTEAIDEVRMLRHLVGSSRSLRGNNADDVC